MACAEMWIQGYWCFATARTPNLMGHTYVETLCEVYLLQMLLQLGPEVSGHFQNHRQNQQKWAFSKIENKYFLVSIVYHISQSSNISLGEVSSQVNLWIIIDQLQLVFKVRIVVGISHPHANSAKTTPKFPKVEIQPIHVLNTLVLIGAMIQFFKI